jgi:protein-tyrosine phosphatase
VQANEKLKVLFVCLGNICRSPLAEGVFRHLITQAGLEERFEIDSAGTSSYHVGDPPDERTSAVALKRGITLAHAARQITATDLCSFDYVIVMDTQNLANVQKLAAKCDATTEVHLLREFDSKSDGDRDVPDPYYGGPRGFEAVHDIVERSCQRLLAHIRTQHKL